MNLEGNELRNDGAVALAGMLTHNRGLQTVVLDWNPIGQAGLESLIALETSEAREGLPAVQLSSSGGFIPALRPWTDTRKFATVTSAAQDVSKDHLTLLTCPGHTFAVGDMIILLDMVASGTIAPRDTATLLQPSGHKVIKIDKDNVLIGYDQSNNNTVTLLEDGRGRATTDVVHTPTAHWTGGTTDRPQKDPSHGILHRHRRPSHGHGHHPHHNHNQRKISESPALPRRTHRTTSRVHQ
mmetsp:Transcript_57991/g.124766  ORF Transcript_57991/g.124766 Transcript_57991/m.124766 type:complete len:240 (-) Transcript_57991:46-765(-)